MSTVVDSRKIGSLVWTTFNYAGRFLKMVRDHRVKQAIVDPFNLNMDDILEEEFMVLEDWWEQSGTRWANPTQRYHVYIGAERAALARDWPPPVYWLYTTKFIQAASLPQFPQTRVLIPDKTDASGKKRSIRVHPAEKTTRVRGPI